MDYILIVIIVFGLVLLALMASQIDITLEPQEINPIPKILIKFRKDSSFFNFLRSNRTIETSKVVDADESYINEIMIGEAQINYGENATTLAKFEVTLKAKKDTHGEYLYFIGNSNSKFKSVEGFLDTDSVFKTINKHSSWDGTSTDGLFFNLHKIILPVKKLYTGQKLKLKYHVQVFAHYREITEGIDITYHSFFFRCLNTTKNGIYKFILPKGEESKVTRLDFISEYNNREVLNYELEVKDGLFNLPDDYGLVWINIKDNSILVQWNVVKESPQSTIFKLKWYTEPLV